MTVVRGAAGSGKTSTALFSLRATTGATVNQLEVEGRLPARVLVLTYNKSLSGYISAVANEELSDFAGKVELEINNFDKWSTELLGRPRIDTVAGRNFLASRVGALPRDAAFLLDECDYLLGRFPHDQLARYLDTERTGRGARPQMDRAMRRRVLDEVVLPYQAHKQANGYWDFHDVAMAMQAEGVVEPYDVIVVDEAQDLSANQLRAVAKRATPNSLVTFVIDTAQRIYPRGSTWTEAGVKVGRTFSLDRNYRNTVEIAKLAAAVAQGVPMDEEGSLPDPSKCERHGPKPVFARGRFRHQAAYAIERLKELDLTQTTIGFLHLKGGGWFDYLRDQLLRNGIDYCELQSTRDWPEDGANVGLSTLHSAKGLEFDHVFLLGLSEQCASYGDEPHDDRQENLRRLLAMAIGRARLTVTLGAQQGDELAFLASLDDDVVQTIEL